MAKEANPQIPFPETEAEKPEPNFGQLIGNQLREFLKQNRITGISPLNQAELGQITGLSQGYLSQLMGGKVENPTINTVLKIANIFGLTVSQLIAEEEGERGEVLATRVENFLRNSQISKSDKQFLSEQLQTLLDYLENRSS